MKQRRCTKTPGSGRTRRGESFLRLAASPDTTPTVTPSPEWDCGTRSGTRPGKTGFHSLPAHGATYLSESFPREKPRAFFGSGGKQKRKKKAPQRPDRWEERCIERYSIEPHGKTRAVVMEGWVRVRQQAGGIKVELHEKID